MFKQLGASAVFKLEDELAIPSAVTFVPLAIAPIASAEILPANQVSTKL